MEKKLLVRKGKYSFQLTAFLKRGFAILLFMFTGLYASASVLTTDPDCSAYGNGDADNIVFYVNGVVAPLSSATSGDEVKVCFDLSAGADPTIFSLVAYSAPAATFSAADAHLQTIYDIETATVLDASGTVCLTVNLPDCFFQLDFVKGCAIVQLGPDGSGNFYSAQGRLIAGLNGGSGACNCVAGADAGVDATLNCGTTSLMLNGSTYVHNPVISWTAAAGGSITAGDNTLNPTVSASGTYILTVTDTLGCSAMDTLMVDAAGTVNVDLGADVYVCAGGSIVLDAGNAGLNFMWNTGATTQTITVSANGTYSVAVDNGAGCMDSDTVNVTVFGDIEVDLGLDATISLCEGAFTLDAGNAGASFMWNTGATTQTIDVTASGMYYVTVTGAGGCTASDTINVTVNPGTLVVDLGNDTTLYTCITDMITLDAGVGAMYLWSTGATTQTITVNVSGTYYVDVTTSLGCTDSDTIVVIVNDNAIDLDLGVDTTLCGCIELNAAVLGGSYMWCSGENYPTLNVCESGMYCVTVTNGTCIAYDTINVTINAGPMVDLGADTTMISGFAVLDAGNVGASFMWSTGATTQAISVTASGTYYVTVTDMYGCTDSDTIIVNLISGISENAFANAPVSIYPNPSADHSFTMSFDMPERGDIEIRIINQLGKVVYSERLNDFHGSYAKKISLENCATGMYFAEIMRADNRKIMKVSLD